MRSLSSCCAEGKLQEFSARNLGNVLWVRHSAFKDRAALQWDLGGCCKLRKVTHCHSNAGNYALRSPGQQEKDLCWWAAAVYSAVPGQMHLNGTKLRLKAEAAES